MFKSLIFSSALVFLLSSWVTNQHHGQEITGEKSLYFSPLDMALDEATGSLFVVGKTALELRSYQLDNLESYTSFFTALPP